MSVCARDRNERDSRRIELIDDGEAKSASGGTGQAKAYGRKRLGSSSLNEHLQTKKQSVQSVPDAITTQQSGSNYSFDGIIDGHAHAHFGDNIHHNHYYDTNSRKVTPTSEEEFQHLLKSLAFTRMGARERIVADASPTTCEWLFEHQDFKAWIDDDKMLEHCGFLWIKGKPGTGKSTIMKQAKSWIDNMSAGQIVLSYFFNARSADALEKSTLGLWRSLTHQLLMVDINSRAAFLQMFASKIPRFENGKLGTVESWEEAELQNWLVENIRRNRHHPLPLNIFIDALDEGHDEEVLRLINFLEEVASRAASTNHILRICLSSRHYPHIHIRHGLSLVVENQQGHTHDIEIYVINHLRGASSKELDGLRAQVVQRSQGIFLWVVLVIPLLNRVYGRGRGVTAMAERLQELPEDLHNLFAALLNRDLEGIDEVTTLLQWVQYSLEPITPDMLQTAIVQAHKSPTTDPDPPTDPNDVEIYLLNCSRGLVEAIHYPVRELYRSTLSVQFIHQSVRDFLTGTYQRTANDSSPAIQQAEACHAEMAKTCLQYLARLSAGGPLHVRTLNQWRLAPYAAKFWWQHVKLSRDACDQELKSLASDFLCDSTSLLTWLQLYNIDRPPRAMTADIQVWTRDPTLPFTYQDLRDPIYYAVATDLFHLLPQGFTGHTFDINARTSELGSPLQLASSWGNLATLRALLQAGANPNADVLNSPLQLASENGFENIVATLLQAGARADACGCLRPCDHFALNRASAQGHETIAQMLLDAGANINARAPQGKTSLMSAASSGRENVVKLLLSRGADTTPESDRGAALTLALSAGHNEVVYLLAKHGKGKNISSKAQLGEVLIIAVAFGDVELVSMIVDRGVDVNYKKDDIFSFFSRRTPLLLAVSQCQLNIVQVLLNAKAYANVLDIRDALRQSGWSKDTPRRRDMEEFLRQKGLLD